MKRDARPPFRSLRDLVVKELQTKNSLLIWNDDPSFAMEKLNAILDSEAYILDRYARDYLHDLASGLSIEDYYRSIANTRMPFELVCVEAILDFPEDGGETSVGALVTDEADGIRVFSMMAIHSFKPWAPLYSGAEVIFHPGGQVSCEKTPIAGFNNRMGDAGGLTATDMLNDDIDKSLRIGGLFAILCAALARPKILDREGTRALPKSEARAHVAAGRRPPRFAPSVIRLSRAGRAERDAHSGAGGAASAARAAYWVRGHLFLARNGRLTWRRAHVRGGGDPTERVNYVTE
ncbi:MAG: hypothetical protein Q4G49_00635 [Paracoccus sp. (in: a-proteobacteria)]|nr:hypothetical protein [Paracoccus sp. (in: a-proteobacteria)]